MSPVKIPAAITEYTEALDAWNLEATRWLGLDPDEVTDLSVDRDEHGCTVGQWESIEPQKPTRGYVVTGAKSNGDDLPVYTGSVSLDWRDTKAFMEAVGPKPDMFTPAERDRLEALRCRALHA